MAPPDPVTCEELIGAYHLAPSFCWDQIYYYHSYKLVMGKVGHIVYLDGTYCRLPGMFIYEG